jgi:hypothetical protein
LKIIDAFAAFAPALASGVQDNPTAGTALPVNPALITVN